MSVTAIDIETLPTFDNAWKPTFKLGNLKDPLKIEERKAEQHRKQYRDTALDPMWGWIFCVGIKPPGSEAVVLHGANERATLVHLENTLEGLGWPRLVAHNGKGFDYPYIAKRAAHHGLWGLAKWFNAGTRETLLDTMTAWAGSRWVGDAVSLSSLARFLGVELGRDLDSGDIYYAYMANQHDRIIEHCRRDILALEGIYNAMSKGGWFGPA